MRRTWAAGRSREAPVLRRCDGCGSYRGEQAMTWRQLPAGVVWHCAPCWDELVAAAQRWGRTELGELRRRYGSRLGAERPGG